MILQSNTLKGILVIFFVFCFQESYPQKLSYEALYKMGIEAYNLQHYNEAYKCFNKAQFNPQKPKKNDLKDWLFSANKKIAHNIYNEQWQSRYYYVSPFTEGRAYVYKSGKYAFVNEAGDLLTPFNYDYVTNYELGLAKVFINQKAGIIDLSGNEIIPCNYDDIEGINSSLFIVKQSEKEYLYDVKKRETISDGYGNIYPLSNQLFSASNYEDWNHKYWIVDISGEKIDTFTYTSIHNFNGNYALAFNGTKRTIIDSNGNQVIPFTDLVLENLGDGFFRCKKDFFVLNNSKLVKLKVESLEKISDGFYLITRNKFKGILSKSGEIVVAPKYSLISAQPNNLFIVAVKQKYGVYNPKGKLISKLVYDKIENYSDGLALVRKDGAFGFIDTLGNLKIPVQNRKALPFSEGLAVVQQKGLFGFINTANELVIPCKYSSAESFENGEAKVKERGREFSIDKNGNEIEKINKTETTTNWEKLKLDTKVQADILDLLNKPSSRFLYDTLFNVGGYWLTYKNLLTMNIDSLRAITSEDEFLYWSNFVAVNEHNFIRFCYNELVKDITKSKNQPKNISLQVNQKLVKSAYLHSKDMYDNNYFSHSSRNGRNSGARMRAQNYKLSSGGENIARFQESIGKVMADWITSTGHFMNIIDLGYNEMGIGCYNRVWTVNFGSE